MLNSNDAKLWARGSNIARDYSLDPRECTETNEDGSRWRLVPTGRKYRGYRSTTTEFICVERLPDVKAKGVKN